MSQNRIRYPEGVLTKITEYRTELASVINQEELLAYKDTTLKERIKQLEKQRDELTAKKKNASDRNKWLSAQIKNLVTQKIVITDHAIVRYLERVQGLDIESIADEMIPPDILGKVASRSTKKESKTYYWETDKGYQIYSEGNEVLTIVTSKEEELVNEPE